METADIEAIPIMKTFDLKDEKDAYDAAEEMVRIGFYKEKKRIQSFNAKRIKENSKTNWIYNNNICNCRFEEGWSRERHKILDISP